MLDVFDTSQQTSLPHRTLDADVLVDHALPAIFIMVEVEQVRVLLDVTIHDFPCIDLSLDYQDVSPSAKKRAFLPRFSAVFASEIDLPVEIEAMGNRQTDIRTGVSKQRLKADGTPVGEDYSSDDYLNNFKRIGSMTPSGNEARITAPLKLNLSLNLQNITFKPLNLKPLGSPLSLDFDDWDDEEFEGESRNVVVNGYDIDAAVFEDLTPFGAKEGCWKDNCLRSDKFNCDSMDHCATVCSQVPKCSWWTWGVEEFAAKCWLRTGTSRKSKRYGFSSGTRNCTVALKTATTTPAADGASEVEALKARRLSSFDDLPQGWDLPLGSMLHMPIFEWRDKESELRREMKGESCRIHGYFDVNRVPGNFHIGVHGAMVPSYLSFYDEPAPPQQNMRHTINSLAFIDVPYKSGGMSRPLDGFESPKAFTFQYYLMITPVTRKTRAVEWGYQFKAASFVTNELIGPAVFFRMDFDPIRVTYFTEHAAGLDLLF
ncbi:Endoplasmic reticulum-Golgi intermediate compartment protein 1 (ER-Golgi intermediate compartment 32 kDa protein) (ERGIC-32) [Durusdinium trenchii]|uniref:Endoplasmic reticulum-Golgi intermediate compartment protein 1 (ER-Golgi intermediate compartment 32 kDa protein) (ERGIC-32) n=1 Tax=Durusdinium trenchii TaxID=1381693 RepID=A0ABP0MY47_9DINO